MNKIKPLIILVSLLAVSFLSFASCGTDDGWGWNDGPTYPPTVTPSPQPTVNPTDQPTAQPTSNPTAQPITTINPTVQPTPAIPEFTPIAIVLVLLGFTFLALVLVVWRQNT